MTTRIDLRAIGELQSAVNGKFYDSGVQQERITDAMRKIDAARAALEATAVNDEGGK